MDNVRTMGDKLRDAISEIELEHPECQCLFAAPPFKGKNGHIYCKIYDSNESGSPIGDPLKVVQLV